MASILQSIPLRQRRTKAIFDGANIWFRSGVQRQTLSEPRLATKWPSCPARLSSPTTAFDGERILVTNYNAGGVS
jgi:hypothetical protein